MPPQRPTRKRGKDQDNTPGMVIDFEGAKYTLRQSDITPRLVAELRRETGFAGWTGLAAEAQRGFDLDTLAAAIWLVRRVRGEAVSYGEVLDAMSYEADVNITVEDKRVKSAALVDGEAVPEA